MIDRSGSYLPHVHTLSLASNREVTGTATTIIVRSASYLLHLDTLSWESNREVSGSAGTILASCSDDNTARVWSTSSATCIHRLAEHSKEIYTIKWRNTGQGTANPQARLLLVTASFDATIRC